MNHFRIILYGLTMCCPYDYKCNFCPVEKIREIEDFEKRVDYVTEIEYTELVKIINYHKNRNFDRSFNDVDLQ